MFIEITFRKSIYKYDSSMFNCFFLGCEVDTMISIESAIFEGYPSSPLGACVALVRPATVLELKLPEPGQMGPRCLGTIPLDSPC